MLLQKKHSFISFLICFNNWLLIAQINPSKNISVLDGLANNQVEDIYKDSRGIIWIGTQNGLSKIDNDGIKSFFTEDGLSNNAIWAIEETKDGNLWLGSYGGGITKYDGYNFIPITTNKKLNTARVRKLLIHKNDLFIGTEKGLFILNLNTEEIKEYETHHDRFQIMDFVVYKNEVYIGVYRRAIFKYDAINSKLIKVRDIDVKRSAVFSLFLDEEKLYFGNYANKISNRLVSEIGAVDVYDIDGFLTNQKHEITYGESIIWDYFKDLNGAIYGAAWGVHSNDGGVFKFADNKFEDFTSNFGVESNQVRRFYFDESSNRLFVGTQDKGLYLVELDNGIKFYETPDFSVIDVVDVNDKLVLLHNKGLTLVRADESKVISSKDFLDTIKNYYLIEDYDFFKSIETQVSQENIIFKQLKFQFDSYWVSTNYGLFRIENINYKMHFYPLNLSRFDFDNNQSLIAAISYGEVCIYKDIVNNRIYYDKPELNKKTCYETNDKNNPNHITEFALGNNKQYMSSPLNGLYEYDYSSFKSLNNTSDLPEKEFTHLAVSKETNKLIVASNSGKLYVGDITSDFKLIKTYAKSDYIGNSIVFLETYKNSVIVGTEKGITVFKGNNLLFIDKEQGLDMNDIVSSKLIDGKLYISTEKGYYELQLEKLIFQKKKANNITLKDIKVNGISYNDNKRKWFKNEVSTFELPYDNNNLNLSFLSENHPYPNKLKYSYQVLGIDTTWSNYTDSKQISLPYLPDGEFAINVKVKDLSSGFYNKSTVAEIKILPPFWKTWWFYTIVLFMAIAIIIFVYKTRIAIVRKKETQKAKIQKRITETKLEALRSQMNPHFIFNALNSIQNYVIDNDVDNALHYLSEFAKLIRKTLNNSSLKSISLSEEISYLKSYIALENMRYNNKVEVLIDSDNLDTSKVFIPPMLIQPFVENVFVHAFNKTESNPKLSISFSKEAEILNCVIEDNGSGISSTISGQLHKSKGFDLLRERLNLLDTSIQNFFIVDSKEGKGTIITLKLQVL